MKAKLSMAFEDLRGKDGNVVIRKSRTGLVLTPLVTPRNPQSTAQREVRQYLSDASSTFKSMSTSEVQAWDDYCQTITRTNPISGETYHPTPINEFVALASKFLQVTPTGTIPVAPPSSSFAGDSLTLAAVAGTGDVTITADAANSAGTTTEFLVQRLNSPHVTPQPGAYTHADFHAFTGAVDPVVLTLSSGYWALAYRYVDTATGQMTDLLSLPIQEVTLSLTGNGSGRSSKKKAA